MPTKATTPRICEQCGLEFHIVTAALRQPGQGRFCSRTCRDLGATRPSAERFWPKVQRGDGCWEWRGGYNTCGYGSFWHNNKSTFAHRVAYELSYGTIPDGLWVLHRCDNRACVRPDHLFLGDRTDNVRDAAKKGRLVHRLSPTQRATIRARYADKSISQTDLAREYGVARTSIQQVLRSSW